MSSQTTFQPQDYLSTFDPDAYVEHYFSKESIEDGTRVSLFALPVFAHIIRQQMLPHERETFLDVGAGPTVYSALCFRDMVKKVYLTDFVPRNLEILKEWVRDESSFDWVPTMKVIRRTEGVPLSDDYDIDIERARGLVKSGGVLFADVHQDIVVPDLPMEQVDVLLTIFTLESACQNYSQYLKCMGNITKQLRSGGRFILGSVLEDDAYNSGRQLIFSLLNLTEEMIMNALSASGIDLNSIKKYVLPEEGVMFLMATKL